MNFSSINGGSVSFITNCSASFTASSNWNTQNNLPTATYSVNATPWERRQKAFALSVGSNELYVLMEHKATKNDQSFSARFLQSTSSTMQHNPVQIVANIPDS
jgi:hypothetical protein